MDIWSHFHGPELRCVTTLSSHDYSDLTTFSSEQGRKNKLHSLYIVLLKGACQVIALVIHVSDLIHCSKEAVTIVKALHVHYNILHWYSGLAFWGQEILFVITEVFFFQG